MNVLVIPDVHLKPEMFKQASVLMKSQDIDRCVCLMDIPDDWNKQFNISLYEETFKAAIKFQKDHPDTLWCWGNHDLSYVWGMSESGYSKVAEYTVRKYIDKLLDIVPDDQIEYIHHIDDVLFMHGGLSALFVKTHLEDLGLYDDVDTIISWINSLGPEYMWTNASPIWYRPQLDFRALYKQDTLLQVVGHTPVRKVNTDTVRNFISCDVFSTESNGTRYGEEKFPVIDTKRKCLCNLHEMERNL